VIQAIGGGIASLASINENLSLSNVGTHIMVAGICWQMFSMAIFVTLVILFIINVVRARLQLPHKLRVFCGGMALVTVMIFVRCIYRTIELLGGWKGYIITHEVYFITLEEVPMLIALLTFNVFHPGQYTNDIESLLSPELPRKAKDVEADSNLEIVKPGLAS
jgi:exosortase/archaeosortase